jgi:hypothetical protein
MHTLELTLEGAFKVLVAGLILGAGLPALFALGIRSLAYGQGSAGAHAVMTPRPIGRLFGWLCFLIVMSSVALGILYIVVTGLGDKLSFSHLYPAIVAT